MDYLVWEGTYLDLSEFWNNYININLNCTGLSKRPSNTHTPEDKSWTKMYGFQNSLDFGCFGSACNPPRELIKQISGLGSNCFGRAKGLPDQWL